MRILTCFVFRYVGVDKIKNHVDKYIIPSAHGNSIGIISACMLAKLAADGN